MESERDDDLLQKQITRIELSERLAFIQEMLRELSDQVVCTIAGHQDEAGTLLHIVCEMLEARAAILQCTNILNRKFIDKSEKHSLIQLGFAEQINRPEESNMLIEKKREQNRRRGKSIEKTDANSQLAVS
jgi:hypothetical protein